MWLQLPWRAEEGRVGAVASGRAGGTTGGQPQGARGHAGEGSGVGAGVPSGCGEAAGQSRVPPSRHSHAKGAAVERCAAVPWACAHDLGCSGPARARPTPGRGRLCPSKQPRPGHRLSVCPSGTAAGSAAGALLSASQRCFLPVRGAPTGRENLCAGKVFPGSPDRMWRHILTPADARRPPSCVCHKPL